jgi:hypothetical protein
MSEIEKRKADALKGAIVDGAEQAAPPEPAVQALEDASDLLAGASG